MAMLNLEVPYPFTPANTPLGHCPSPLEQWPPQLANRVRPSSRSAVNPADLPSPSGAAAQRDPRCAQTAAHCTHTGCPLDSPRLPTTHARANLFYCARQARPVSLTDAHCSHTGCPLVSPRLPTGLTQVAHWTHPGCQSSLRTCKTTEWLASHTRYTCTHDTTHGATNLYYCARQAASTPGATQAGVLQEEVHTWLLKPRKLA